MQVVADHLLQPNIALPGPRQADKAIHLGGMENETHKRLTLRTFQIHHQSHAEIGDEGEWMGRIDGNRRQHRQDLVHEVPFEPGTVIGLERVHAELVDTPAPRAARPARAQQACWLAISRCARSLIAMSCSAGVRPSWLMVVHARPGSAPSGRPREPCRTRRDCLRKSRGTRSRSKKRMRLVVCLFKPPCH